MCWNSLNLELEFVVCWQNKQNSVSNMAWMRKSYYYFLCIFWLYQKRSDENIRSSSKNSLFKKHYWLSSGWQHNNRFLNCKFYLLADFYQRGPASAVSLTFTNRTFDNFLCLSIYYVIDFKSYKVVFTKTPGGFFPEKIMDRICAEHKDLNQANVMGLNCSGKQYVNTFFLF